MTELPSRHLDAATIADVDAGVLPPADAAAAADHLATCDSCRQIRADLAEVSALLGSAPIPPMPVDVARRIDTALADAADARGSGSNAAERVVELVPRRRRWLAPLAAAAAAAVGIAVIGQVGNPSGGGVDSATSGSAEETFQEGGAAVDGPPDAGDLERRPPPELSSGSFRRDVAREVYGRASATPAQDLNRFSVEELDGLACTPDRLPAKGRAEAMTVLLDGQAALLYLSGPSSDRLAVAVTCQYGRLTVAARTRIDLE